MLLVSAQATECKCDCNTTESKVEYAIGTILSWGEGRGIEFRNYFGDSYIQQAGYIFAKKDSYTTSLLFNYGLSYGHYLFSNKTNYFHLKSVVGAEYSYSYDFEKDSYGDGSHSYKNIDKEAIASGGFGLEIGYLKRGSILVGMDMLYIFTYDFENSYKINPSVAIYLQYNY